MYAKALLRRKNVKDEQSGMSSKRQRLIRNKSLDPNEISKYLHDLQEEKY